MKPIPPLAPYRENNIGAMVLSHPLPACYRIWDMSTSQRHPSCDKNGHLVHFHSSSLSMFLSRSASFHSSSDKPFIPFHLFLSSFVNTPQSSARLWAKLNPQAKLWTSLQLPISQRKTSKRVMEIWHLVTYQRGGRGFMRLGLYFSDINEFAVLIKCIHFHFHWHLFYWRF